MSDGNYAVIAGTTGISQAAGNVGPRRQPGEASPGDSGGRRAGLAGPRVVEGFSLNLARPWPDILALVHIAVRPGRCEAARAFAALQNPEKRPATRWGLPGARGQAPAVTVHTA